MLRNFCFLLISFTITDQINFESTTSNETMPRIMDGQEMPPHTYSFQVALLIYLFPVLEQFQVAMMLCGGSLISKNWILTAAHCLYGAKQVEAIIGAHDLGLPDDFQVRLYAELFIIHPGYSDEHVINDIALAKLPPDQVHLSRFVSLVPLPKGKGSYEKMLGLVVGWGATERSDDDEAVLRGGWVTVLDSEDCAQFGPMGLLLTERHLCVVGDTRPCIGDSGGPLLIGGVLVGVVSFGTSTCAVGTPTVFTRVDSFTGWIKEHTSCGNLGDPTVLVKIVMIINVLV